MRYITTIFILLFVVAFSWGQKPDAIKEYNGGLEYYNFHNYEAAIPFFEAAIKKDPSFVNAYRVLIACHEQEGDLKKTIPLYEQVIDLLPSDKQVCYNFALTYVDLQDYNKALLYINKALSIDATYTKAANKKQEIETFLEKRRAREDAKTTNDAQSSGNSKNIENITYNNALKEYRNEAYGNCLAILNDYLGEVTNPDFHYLKAIALQHLGERENAIDAYEQTLELDDRHFNANLNLGKIYYNDKNFEEAVHLLETAFLRRKNDQKLLVALAKAHYYAKQYKAAIPYFEDYTSRNSKNGEVWRLLGESYSKIGKSKNASKAFEQAKQYGMVDDDLNANIQNSIAKYGNEAKEYTKNGNYDKAIQVLEKAIMEHSETASLHFNLGLNYMEIGNVNKARSEFKKTIDLEPSHAKAYQGLGQIYYEREEFSEAAAYYLATVDAGKHDQYVYYKLGSCYYRLNRFNKAIDAYNKAIEYNPKEKRYYFALGLTYLGLEEAYKAIEAMEQALAIDPMFLDAQYHICISYIQTSQYEKCIAEAEKILKKNSDYAKAYLVMGHAHKRMGNYVLAAEYQKKAERMDPTLRQ